VPSFVNICLQLIKPPPSSRTSHVPMSLVEKAMSAVSVLIPLYPTTLRPFSGQIRSIVRPYVAPTSSTGGLVPHGLRLASQHTLILLHFTALKNGNADEWTKALEACIQDAHSTAGRIFRSIRESWESTSGVVLGPVTPDGEPHGGGDAPEELPAWSGMESGSQRLIGLLELLEAFFRCPTKGSVKVSLNKISDLLTRLALVLPPEPGATLPGHITQANPMCTREERDALWSVMPSIHVAGVKLAIAMVERLRANITPMAPELLDQTVRIFSASRHLSEIREVCFLHVRGLLPFSGRALPNITVDSLKPVIHACCRDLLSAVYLTDADKHPTLPLQNGTKSKITAANAERHLEVRRIQAFARANEQTQQHAEAGKLLEALLTHLPEPFIKKAERALMDQTAILTCSKTAMVASVLHPYEDSGGRQFANIFPFLARAYPQHLDVEVLRSNLRTTPYHFTGSLYSEIPNADAEEERQISAHASESTSGFDQQLERSNDAPSKNGFGQSIDTTVTTDLFDLPIITENVRTGDNVAPNFEPLNLKRKSVEDDPPQPKRTDKGKAPDMLGTTILSLSEVKKDLAESDSDGESVQLQAILEDDEDEDNAMEDI
jgi:pre-rRNA-processing protein RIX1